jgi:hypothetical protein
MDQSRPDIYMPPTTRILRDAFPMMTDNVPIRAIPPECTMSQLSEKGASFSFRRCEARRRRKKSKW